MHSDLDNIFTMDEFWEIDILILIDEGRFYAPVIFLCLAWSSGLSIVIIAMMQYVADVLIVVSIAAVSIFLIVSVGLLWFVMGSGSRGIDII